jgi:hypothetical protein
MATLIFDIETKGTRWGELPGITRAALTGWIDRSHVSDEVKQQKREEMQSRLALSPFTGGIISLAVYDRERQTGAVYYVSDQTGESYTEDGITYNTPPRTIFFWKIFGRSTKLHDNVSVTFNVMVVRLQCRFFTTVRW